MVDSPADCGLRISLAASGMLTTLAVAGYRSLRDFAVRLDALNLVTGSNGSGKSNLYRALRLLADAAQGRVSPRRGAAVDVVGGA